MEFPNIRTSARTFDTNRHKPTKNRCKHSHVADSEQSNMVSVGDQEPRFVYFRSNDECRIRCDTARVAQAPSGGAVVDRLGSTSPLGYDLAVVLANKTPLKVSQRICYASISVSSLHRACSPLLSTDTSKTFFSINISSRSAGSTAIHPKEIK